MKPVLPLKSLLAVATAMLLAACSTTETASTTEDSSGRQTQTQTASAPRQAGGAFNQATSYFPTGTREGSALEITKVAPKETILGQPFSYRLEVKNISGAPIKDVTITDSVSANFEVGSISPQPTSAQGNKLAWKLDSIAAGQTVTINVNGTPSAAGIVEHCATATYTPVVCAETRIVEAAIAIEKTLPDVVLVCDPIPMRIVVRNNGSSRLSNVRVTDTLPAGLTTADGSSSVNQDIGTLEAGQSREIAVNLKASQTGAFENTASASSAEGVSAKDSAEVRVIKPQLAVTCVAPERRFAGRPIEVCVTARNTGAVTANNARVVLSLPSGTSFRSATRGGVQQGNTVVWDLGAFAGEAEQQLCATVVSDAQGTLNFAAAASGNCADEVRTSCSTIIAGIPALLLEVVDLNDPIEVGNNQTYEIIVTNQGTAPATNVAIACSLEDSQSFVSAGGASSASATGREIKFAAIPSIAAKAKVTWTVVVKAEKAGDVRFTTVMTSSELERPVQETESTSHY